MNIVQLHERVYFWLDRVGSTRFEPLDIDNSLNIAQNDIVKEKYSGSKLFPNDSFQVKQKVRDELSNLVKESNPTITHGTGIVNIAKADIPTDYRYLLSLALYDSTDVRHSCLPLTYDRENVIEKNPFRRTRSTIFPKIYYNELNTGIIIKHAFTVNPTSVQMHYLSSPVDFNYGNEYNTGHDFVVGNIVIAVSDEVVYNGVTYKIGDSITIVSGNLQITSGTVIFDYTLSDINDSLYETIARRSAINLLLSSEQQGKAIELVKFFD